MDTILNNVRLDYVNVWQPVADLQGNLKYGVCVLMPDSNKMLKAACERAIEEVLQGAISTGSIPATMKSKVTRPLRDGTEEYTTGQKKNIAYKGFTFFNARTNEQPTVVDGMIEPIIDQGEMYSGVWANVAVSFYFTNNGGTARIAVGLNHVQKVSDDDKIGGRSNVADVFKKLTKHEGPDDNPFNEDGEVGFN